MTLSLRLLRSFAQLQSLTPQWRALHQRVKAPVVMSPTWLCTWWRTFGGSGGRRLRTLAVFDGNTLVGLMPLLLRPVRVGPTKVMRLELLGSGEAEADEICSDYLEPLVDERYGSAVARAFAHGLGSDVVGRWDELELTRMATEDRQWPSLLRAALFEAGIDVQATQVGICHYLPLAESWEAYLASLDGKKRYFVKRSLKELNKFSGGDHQLKRVSKRGELEAGMAILKHLHQARWEGGGVFHSRPFSQFHHTVSEALLSQQDGNLDLLWLEVGGKPIAAVYNYIGHGKVGFYQSGRVADAPPKLRPGIALHLLAIQHSIEMGYGEYDFLDGNSPYKRKLSTHSRPLMHWRAVAPNLRGMGTRLKWATRQSALNAARSIKGELLARFKG